MAQSELYLTKYNDKEKFPFISKNMMELHIQSVIIKLLLMCSTAMPFVIWLMLDEANLTLHYNQQCII